MAENQVQSEKKMTSLNVSSETRDALTLPVVETRGFSVLRGLPSGTDIVL